MNREFEFIRELWAPTKMDTYVVNKFFCTGAYVKNISLIIIYNFIPSYYSTGDHFIIKRNIFNVGCQCFCVVILSFNVRY